MALIGSRRFPAPKQTVVTVSDVPHTRQSAAKGGGCGLSCSGCASMTSNAPACVWEGATTAEASSPLHVVLRDADGLLQFKELITAH